MRRIKPLPEAVRSSVRSGIILYDLTRVVEELVFNSLDAGATKVSVAVDVGTCFVKVVDNGSGIDRDGLVLVGQRYATSKHGQVADLDANDRNYGSRGEALCSISDVSLLEIITKAHGRPHGYRKVMKGCKSLYLGINDDRHDVGTTVVVRDLFYNQPVRRKHMLSSLKKVLHLVKKSVLRIALVHPGVSFRVVDIESEDELLSTHPSPSPLPLLSSNFGIEAACSLHELKASEGDFKLSGYMSGPFGILSLKAFQYIYINSRFVCKGPIHKLLNQLAAAYWDNKKFSIGVQNKKRSRSQIYPTFILNVSCPRSYYDTTFETLRNSVEFVDWDPVLVFIQNAVTDFWSEYKSNDFPVNSGSGRKRSRTSKCQALPEASSSETQKRIEDCNFLSAGRENSSSSQKSCGDASELNKCQTDALFIHDDGRAIQLCGVTANRKIHKTMQPSGGYFSDEYDLLVKQLSTKDACRKEVDNFVDSQWQDESFEMEDWVNKSKKSPPYTLSHEFGDDADVNQVFRKPTQLSCSRGRCLQDVGPFFVCKAGIEFKSDDFSMQQKWLDIDEGVDFGRQDDIDKLFKESLSRKNEIKPLWSFSRCTNQHDTVANSNILSQDLRSSLIAGECSGEENCLLSDPFKHIEQLSHNEHSSTSEWSPLAENSLFDGENGSFEFGEGTRCAYSPDREGDYCKLDFNTAINGWDQQNCTEFSSDCEFSGLQGDVNEIGGHRIKDNIFPDEMDLLHIHFFDKNGLSKFLDPLDHKSLRAQSSRNKYGRTPIRNEETMFHHKGVRRSHSAPPFYKPRRKYFALNHLLNSEAGRFNSPAINNGSSFPGTSNLKHKQQSFGQCHSPSKANYVDDSLSVPRLENKELQNKGQCVGGCILNPVEDSLPKDNQNVLDSGVKWRNSSPQSAVVVSSLNTRDHDPVLDISSGILHLTGDSLVPSSIDKNCLKDANVLQQVDKKFIPVVADRILVIIDQHAADERIRLEELRQKVLSGEMKQITYLEAEQELVLPEIGYQLLRNYADQIHNWGWICNIYGPGSRSFGKNLNVLYRQPTIAKLIAVPCILGVNLTDVDLLEFLQQLADTDGSATVPPSVNRVLNNKACRGAIMFGDTLLPSECSLIVEELKQTSLCFQCAHGRPTTVPLVNLDVLHKQIDKLGLCSSGTDEPWQGLRRHEISLERAAHRLSSAID